MPAHQMDLQGYANFLTATARDPRFEAGTLIEAIRKQDPDFGWFTSLLYRFVVVKRTRDGHPGARQAERLVRRSSAAGTWPGGHLQPVQADVQLRPEGRHERGHGRPAAALQPARAAGAVAPLGRQQQPGRGAEQERGDRRRRDRGVARPRRRSTAWRSGRSTSSRRCIPPRKSTTSRVDKGGQVYQASCAQVPRPERRGRRAGDTACRDRHRPRAAELVHERAGSADEHDRHRASPGSSRTSARRTATPTCRSTACGSARRTCTTARCRRFARCSSPRNVPRPSIAATTSTTGSAWALSPRAPMPSGTACASTPACAGNSNAGHVYGRELPAADREALLEYLKTL